MTSVRVTQNYLTPLALWDEVKPYEINGRVTPGLARNNLDFTPYEVDIHDVRDAAVQEALAGGGQSSSSRRLFDTTGFAWERHTTSEDLASDASIDCHIDEMKAFLVDYFHADLVSIFQYQTRKRVPDHQDPRVRPPSNFVHIDLSQLGAEARIRFSCPEDADTILGEGRYRMLSLWRPLLSPLEDSPLAVCDSRSVDDDDLLESDYVYPTFVSESLVVKHSASHKWYYLSEQTREEVLIITNYDSGSETRVPHSAFELPATGKTVRPRESIEIKAVVWTKTE